MLKEFRGLAGRILLALSSRLAADVLSSERRDLALRTGEFVKPTSAEHASTSNPARKWRPSKKNFTNLAKNQTGRGLLALRRRLRVPEVFYESGAIRRDGAKQVMGLAIAAMSVSAALPVISSQSKRQQDDLAWRMEASDMVKAMRMAQTNGDSAVLNARYDLSPAVVDALDGALAAHGESLADQRFSAVMHDRQSIAAYQSFTPVHFERAKDRAQDQQCLAEAVYYEARGEAFIGQLAVAEVVANRVADPRYPDSFCGVVYQGSNRVTGCQFTFTCDGSLAHTPRGEAWDRAQEVATHVLVGFHQPVTRGSTHYHTTAVSPRWAPTLTSTRQIGVHQFYRWEEQPVIRYEASLHIPPTAGVVVPGQPVGGSVGTRAALR